MASFLTQYKWVIENMMKDGYRPSLPVYPSQSGAKGLRLSAEPDMPLFDDRSLLYNAKIFELDDDLTFLLQLTDNEILPSIHLPFPLIFIDTRFTTVISKKTRTDLTKGLEDCCTRFYDNGLQAISYDRSLD